MEGVGVRVVFPHGAFGADEDYFVEAIVRVIAEHYGDERNWPTKYGVDYENDVFMMHPFCWCEQEDCPWCNEDKPNFWYKPTDFKVSWYKYIGRGMEFNRQTTIPEVVEMVYRCISDETLPLQ